MQLDKVKLIIHQSSPSVLIIWSSRLFFRSLESSRLYHSRIQNIHFKHLLWSLPLHLPLSVNRSARLRGWKILNTRFAAHWCFSHLLFHHLISSLSFFCGALRHKREIFTKPVANCRDGRKRCITAFFFFFSLSCLLTKTTDVNELWLHKAPLQKVESDVTLFWLCVAFVWGAAAAAVEWHYAFKIKEPSFMTLLRRDKWWHTLQKMTNSRLFKLY